MVGHILEIILMLLGAAIIGFFIGWLLKKDKIIELQEYITALESKNNILQADYNKTERLLIECQTEKRKAEAEKKEIEKLLIDCEGKLTLSEIETARIKTENKSAKTKAKTKIKPDNLKKIEGIGNKIASILNDAGIGTFKLLSNSNPEKIREILLEKGGKRYSIHDPETWPEQAKLAAEEKWDELKVLQDKLKGGRKTKN